MNIFLNPDDFIKAKKQGRKWTMLTAYDAPTAEILESAEVDMILVGDSVGMVVLGYASTAVVTMDEMAHHAKAVRRGAKKTPIIVDMPLRGLEKGPFQALDSAKRFINEAGCDAVKVEWRPGALEIIELLIKNHIPVMGHIGLTPQTTNPEVGFKVQGQTALQAFEIFKSALLLQNAKVFSILLECIPAPIAREISTRLKVPTIGIGAGSSCDGQVLVFHDLVGMFSKFEPRFVKRYAHIDKAIEKAVRSFIEEVNKNEFPDKKHSFSMKVEEFSQFKSLLEEKGF